MSDKKYIVGYKGKQVNLFDHNGKIIRRFIARAEVANAQIDSSGQNPVIAISTKDGKFEMYRADGSVIRRS